MSKEPTLLCIDDDPSVLKVLANYFTRKGFTVFPAEDGAIGLELYHSLHPDIVLVDLKMPGLDGFQVLQTVRADSPDTPIIVEIIYVNCGAIPENLIESEFFGYKKGAFTGAIKDKHGFLDLADGGNLFLDEVGEIPLNVISPSNLTRSTPCLI
jgi:DNA-binding NtrC family response regulator